MRQDGGTRNGRRETESNGFLKRLGEFFGKGTVGAAVRGPLASATLAAAWRALLTLGLTLRLRGGISVVARLAMSMRSVRTRAMRGVRTRAMRTQCARRRGPG